MTFLTDSPRPDKEELRRQIEKQTEDFLARGGKIDRLPIMRRDDTFKVVPFNSGDGKKQRKAANTRQTVSAKIEADYGQPAPDVIKMLTKKLGTLNAAAKHLGITSKTAFLIAGPTRKRITYVIDGVKATIYEHCKRYGMNTRTVTARIARGWTPEEALKTEPKKYE